VIKTYIIVAAVSYLLGSIPFGYILVKLFLKQDIRATGSGNIGATNVARSGAKGLAIATLLLDAVKGVLAVRIAHLIFTAFYGPPHFIDCWLCTPLAHVMQFAVLLAVLGHMFPPWLGFKGGKGVATALGGFLAVNPFVVIITAIAFFIVVAVSRYVSLGSILAAILFPILLHFTDWAPAVAVWPTALVSLLIILKHHQNVRRLLAGTESKFGGKKSVPPPDAMEKQA
jgi:acyl phosphate:glycerol-3-phosphate acyltransferase